MLHVSGLRILLKSLFSLSYKTTLRCLFSSSYKTRSRLSTSTSRTLGRRAGGSPSVPGTLSLTLLFLLAQFPLAAPTRLLRNWITFHVSHARVNTVKNGLFIRIPKLSNMFLGASRDVDLWQNSQLQYIQETSSSVCPLEVAP